MTRSITLEKVMTQADFNTFARLSGDANPIHIDPIFAARTRFGVTVAHGAFLCAVFRGLVDQCCPGATQLAQSVMFPNPAPVGETIRFEASLGDRSTEAQSITLVATRISDGETVCQGHTQVQP